jgi:hypothetical protein
MEAKQRILKEKLLKNISKTRMKAISDIINRKNKNISIRLIEWFVSNYSKTHNIKYQVNNMEFEVHKYYKDEQMCSFNKKLFDMYKRTDTFIVEVDSNVSFKTTVAQLNFFQWAFKYKVIQYVENNFQKIKEDLERDVKNKLSRKKLPKTRKTSKKFYEYTLISRLKTILSFS